ncbi:hypothetical protein HD554DRAFT_2024831, partial [Boletus coccyginus]
YVSTKNILLPKGQSRKLVPKCIKPYKLVKDFGNNSFELDSPVRLKQRGIHPVFYSSLLRVRVPTDDRCLFPGRLETQMADIGEIEPEWSVQCVLSHHGSGTDSRSSATGDVTWLPYQEVRHLSAPGEYPELIEVTGIENLPRGSRQPPDKDPQVFNGSCRVFVDSPTSQGSAT